MNRVIIKTHHPGYATICNQYKPYKYIHDLGYACIEVNDEYLCMLKLQHRLRLALDTNGNPIARKYSDMPTYVIME
jgi:hypothetical protein